MFTTCRSRDLATLVGSLPKRGQCFQSLPKGILPVDPDSSLRVHPSFTHFITPIPYGPFPHHVPLELEPVMFWDSETSRLVPSPRVSLQSFYLSTGATPPNRSKIPPNPRHPVPDWMHLLSDHLLCLCPCVQSSIRYVPDVTLKVTFLFCLRFTINSWFWSSGLTIWPILFTLFP